jgi:hypothetical protein
LAAGKSGVTGLAIGLSLFSTTASAFLQHKVRLPAGFQDHFRIDRYPDRVPTLIRSRLALGNCAFRSERGVC